MEENDDIRGLFENFQPELGGDSAFMDRLERNMNSVEDIRRHTVAMRRRYKRAVVLAACVGFVVGALFTFAVPWLSEWLSGVADAVPKLAAMNLTADKCSVLTWMLAACSSVGAALWTYDMSVSLPVVAADERR